MFMAAHRALNGLPMDVSRRIIQDAREFNATHAEAIAFSDRLISEYIKDTTKRVCIETYHTDMPHVGMVHKVIRTHPQCVVNPIICSSIWVGNYKTRVYNTDYEELASARHRERLIKSTKITVYVEHEDGKRWRWMKVMEAQVSDGAIVLIRSVDEHGYDWTTVTFEPTRWVVRVGGAHPPVTPL